MFLDKNIWNDENLIKVLKEDGVVVMPTDTLYGVVGRAENMGTVERIYAIRKRSPKKPCIILIGDMGELEKFGIVLGEEQIKVIKEYSSFDPTQDLRPTSFVLDCPDDSFKYLHRGTKTLAFRLPKKAGLQNFLLQTGPLVAPSANIEGEIPARNVDEARKYFGNSVDLYIDGGTLAGEPSKIVRLYKNGDVSILRV